MGRQVKGTMVNLNRWFALIRELRSQDEHWHCKLIPMLYACLQLDMLRDGKMEKLLSVKKTSLAEKESAKRAMKETTPEQRSMAASSANLLVTATIMHLDDENQNRCRMLCAVLGPLNDWQGSSNVVLRQANATLDFFLDQMRGGAMNMCNATVQVLSDRVVLRHIGLGCSPSAALNELSESSPETLRDDELASTMGRLALSVCKEFLCRELWRLRGYPAAFAKLTATDIDEVGDAISCIRQDYRRFEHLRQQAAFGRL